MFIVDNRKTKTSINFGTIGFNNPLQSRPEGLAGVPDVIFAYGPPLVTDGGHQLLHIAVTFCTGLALHLPPYAVV